MEAPASILIVEDEAVFALDLRQRLTHLGYEVSSIAVSGEEAMAFADQHQPDLVLMDIRLGGAIDGIEAAQRIVQANDAPVIFITANTDADTVERAKFVRPSGYLIKPIKDKELSTTIEIALYKHRAERAERQQRMVSNVLHQVASVLNSTLNLEQVIDHLLDNLGYIVQHDAAEVILLEEGQPRVKSQRMYSSSETNADKLAPGAASITPLTCPEDLERIFATQEALIIDSISPQAGSTQETYKFKSLAGVPICLSEETIGFLIVFSQNSHVFRDAEIAHLHAFADQTATAMNNARQYRALQQYSEDLENLVSQRTATLHETRSRLEAILDNSPDAVVIFREDGSLEKVNSMFYTLFGYAPEEASAQGFSMLTGLSDTTSLAEVVKQIDPYYSIHRVELKARRKDGSTFDADLALASIRHDNHDSGVVCTIRDVSLRKRHEDELSRARDEAVAAKDFRSRLLAMVSHDLRTPITAIQGYCTLLEMEKVGPLTATQRDYITRMRVNAENLGGLVANLVDQAQLEAGKIILDEAPFKVAQLLHAVETAVADRAHTKKLQLVIEAVKGMPDTLIGDMQRLLQIIINLVTNAIKFTEQGSITVRVAPVDPSHWSIEVRDTGSGIAREDQEHIFEAFEQGKNRIIDENTGIGLGLTIARQLTELMNGEIHLESEFGQGTVVTVRLPLAIEH